MPGNHDTDPATLTLRRRSPMAEGGSDKRGGAEAHLIVLVGHAMGRRYLLGEEMVLGRGPQSPIEILDDGVSRTHCRISRTDLGTYKIEDLGSRNGTYVNGVRITESALQFGDKIAVGSQTILLFASRDRFEDQRIQAQKLQALGQLAGGIAHDFNNLLGVVLANITHLLSLDRLDEGVTRKSLAEVETAARRAVDLTNQLLAFARSSRRQHKATDASTMIGDATRLLRATLHRSITLVTEAPTGLTLIGDPSQLLQVLMNLCINAGDAMPEGGTLTIAANRQSIFEEKEGAPLLAPGQYVVIEVRDTGVGMDPETRSRIFEPFFTTKPRGKGTGLGLATASVIVRDHGGHIEVDSEPGRGTTFRVFLPAAQVKPVVRPRVTQDHYSPVKGTVLLADDEELVRYATRRVLEHAGVSVLAAEDGAKAVDLYMNNRERVELVILDLDMPNLNGEQAFKRLVEIDPDVKVIISSGYVLRERESQLRKAGVYGFLNKPYDSMTLMTTIAKALRERRDGS
ncbi:MAG: ATP-binding protein [Myxococcota bacterium]